jgi:hypothetical protein
MILRPGGYGQEEKLQNERCRLVIQSKSNLEGINEAVVTTYNVLPTRKVIDKVQS